MSTVSVSLPTDGTTADVSDYNTPLTTLLTDYNGNIDNSNIASGAAIARSKIASSTTLWEELARTTLGVAGDTITVSGFGARKYLKILIIAIATGGTIDVSLTFNSDTGAHYSRFSTINSVAGGTATSQSNLKLDGTAAADNKFTVLELVNIQAQEKIGNAFTIQSGAAGAGNAPGNSTQNVKWANTSAQATTVTVTNAGTGDYAIGSEIVVLGHD